MSVYNEVVKEYLWQHYPAYSRQSTKLVLMLKALEKILETTTDPKARQIAGRALDVSELPRPQDLEPEKLGF